MTIKRIVECRQLEFELTAEEMRRVYEELQAEYDRDDVSAYLDSNIDYLMEEFDGMSEKDIRGKTPDFVEAYRRAFYNGENDWWDIAGNAIDRVLTDEIRKRVEDA